MRTAGQRVGGELEAVAVSRGRGGQGREKPLRLASSGPGLGAVIRDPGRAWIGDGRPASRDRVKSLVDSARVVVGESQAGFDPVGPGNRERANRTRSRGAPDLPHPCRDGLEPDGVNDNEGAESTLAWPHSLIRMHELQADGRLGWTDHLTPVSGAEAGSEAQAAGGDA